MAEITFHASHKGKRKHSRSGRFISKKTDSDNHWIGVNGPPSAGTGRAFQSVRSRRSP
jgi:hypothetical protein